MPWNAVLTQIGTGVIVWTPDTYQSPFNLGLSLVIATAGTCTVDVTFDNIQTSTIEANGVGTAGATWWNVIAATGANATANFTTPIQALRLNNVTANATTKTVLTIVQAAGQP